MYRYVTAAAFLSRLHLYISRLLYVLLFFYATDYNRRVMLRGLVKKTAVVAHEVFLIGCALVGVGAVLIPLGMQTAGANKGLLAPVVVRPQVLSVMAAMQPASFGMSFGDTLRLLDAQQLNAQLQDIASIGFTWLRMDIDWSAVQPANASTYDWTGYDKVIDAAKAHNLHVLAVVAYAPAWARQASCAGDSKCAPAGSTAYATFARAAAQRYAAKGVKTWEIWNEPNIHNFWQPTPNAASYTALLKSADQAIKAADPAATVLTAGLAPAEDAGGNIPARTFLSGMYAAGAHGSFDALAFHPYSYPAPADIVYSWSAWSQMADLNTNLRTIMQANGDNDKEIWITEVGAPTGGEDITATPANFRYNLSSDHVDEALQATIAEQAVNAVKSYPWAGPMFWYSYQDLGTDASSNENFFGIIKHNGAKKQIYSTFQRLLQN
jgi:polysaccharide biosynthesis protein PslG